MTRLDQDHVSDQTRWPWRMYLAGHPTNWVDFWHIPACPESFSRFPVSECGSNCVLGIIGPKRSLVWFLKLQIRGKQCYGSKGEAKSWSSTWMIFSKWPFKAQESENHPVIVSSRSRGGCACLGIGGWHSYISLSAVQTCVGGLLALAGIRDMRGRQLVIPETARLLVISWTCHGRTWDFG